MAWLIAFILLWSGLTYVQYDLKDDESEAFQQIVHYDKNIQQSEIAQYLQQSQIPNACKTLFACANGIVTPTCR